MQEHATSFIARTEANTGSELPRFIKDEIDAFLECGILAHGGAPIARGIPRLPLVPNRNATHTDAFGMLKYLGLR